MRIGLAALPDQITWHEIFAVGALGGIGFTMSLFISELAFEPGELQNDARIGILLASVFSGAIAYLLLRWSLPHLREDSGADEDLADAPG